MSALGTEGLTRRQERRADIAMYRATGMNREDARKRAFKGYPEASRVRNARWLLLARMKGAVERLAAKAAAA